MFLRKSVVVEFETIIPLTSLSLLSLSGRVAAPLHGAYAASKFALEAVCDSLRGELSVTDPQMKVSIIEPGAIKTEIWKKAQQKASSSTTTTAVNEWCQPFLNSYATSGHAGQIGPDFTTAAITHAINARKPSTRYLVGLDALIISQFRPLIPDRLWDWLALQSFKRKL